MESIQASAGEHDGCSNPGQFETWVDSESAIFYSHKPPKPSGSH